MTDTTARDQALPAGEAARSFAAFDRARDAFLAAFAQAPDEALPYVPPGDEYALGILPAHLQDSMHHYLDVFERVQQSDFGPVDLASDPDGAARVAADAERHRFIVEQRPTGADRSTLLADLLRSHELVRGRLAHLDDATFTRQAPVVYSAASLPYSTSARDILGWLTDHYDEHIEQVGSMLAQWRAG